MTAEERTIIEYCDRRWPVYREIALRIHARPEICNEEYFACETLSKQLAAEGFLVKTDVAGHPTGFRASYRAKKPGATVAFLAEYDALKGIGHACGHNLFGVTSLLAAAALKQVADDIGGEIRVYGTPGEEGGVNGSAKGSFVREGFFEDVDAALCAHPTADRHFPSQATSACAPVDIEFWGKAAHAAAAPERGVNALDALILTYNGINALRQHVTPDVCIHGVITRGGDAPNTVPDYAAAKFYFRAATAPRLREVYGRIEKIVEGAALMTGAKGRLQPYQNLVENMVLTPSFDAVYAEKLAALGETISVPTAKDGLGSSDVGNVSQVVPTIQPMLSITSVPTAGHSEAFLEAAKSEKGLRAIALGAKALACTALELMRDPALLDKIKTEHREAVAAQT